MGRLKQGMLDCLYLKMDQNVNFFLTTVILTNFEQQVI